MQIVSALTLVLAMSSLACGGAAQPGSSISQSHSTEKAAIEGTIFLADGRTMKLSTLWSNQTVVLTFYRGHFSRSCMLWLSELVLQNFEFLESNARVVAVSADPPERLAAVQKKIGNEVLVGRDQDLALSKAYGAYDSKLQAVTPVTVVIGRGGRIHATYPATVTSDWPELTLLLDAVRTTN